MVGADLGVMSRDAERQRTGPGGVRRPTMFLSLATHPQAPDVTDWIKELIAERGAARQAAPSTA